MGKRKKSTRNTGGGRKKEKLPTQFQCLFCNHETSVQVKIDKKSGTAKLKCRVCGQDYESTAHKLTEPVDVYSEWIDACDAVQKEQEEEEAAAARAARRRPAAATSSAPPAGVQRSVEGGYGTQAAAAKNQYAEDEADDFVVNDDSEGVEMGYGDDD
ncbi:MAG: hypothetical protein M1831_002920 [Alyxoria varia]|nr:MAG: hypothetical protein M1831_002920 [Alyxoria varia]